MGKYRIILIFCISLFIACKKEESKKPQAGFEVFNSYQKESVVQGTVAFKNTSLNASYYKWEITGDSGIVHTYEYEDISHRFYSNGSYNVKLTAYDEKKKKSSVFENTVEINYISEVEYKLTWFDGSVYVGKSSCTFPLQRANFIAFQTPKGEATMSYFCKNVYDGFTLTNGTTTNYHQFFTEIGNNKFMYNTEYGPGYFKYINPTLVIEDQFKFNAEFESVMTGTLQTTLEKKTVILSGKFFCYAKRPY